ncbi:MAG: hypothetical protein EXQ85_00550 [Alphaproteobacteria bacterium]|nr:hypothetical protein [Alphaproteobacteria bacterium]
MHFELVNGADLFAAEFADRLRRRDAALSPPLRRRLDALQATAAGKLLDIIGDFSEAFSERDGAAR